MASTYTDLGVELMATGENAGTWGTKTNANLNLIEQLTGGFLSVSIAGGAGTQALDVDDGAVTGEAQNKVLEFTGSITGNRIITWPVLTENFYIIKNSTSGAYTVQLKAATGSGATVTFSTTEKGYKIIYLDGVATNTGVYDVGIATLTGVETLTNKTLTSPVFSGTATNFTSTGIDDNATSTAITINSSEQVEFTAGTALLPAITTTGDANTGMWFPAADTIAFSEGGSEVMRIDSDGKVGIGTSSPGASLHISSTNPEIRLTDSDNSSVDHFITGSGSALSLYADKNDELASSTIRFYVDNSESMRIDSSGNVFIGKTSTSDFDYGAGFRADDTSNVLLLHRQADNGNVAEFARGGSACGTISVTASSTSYNTSSDYRLKTDVLPMTDATATFKLLKPVNFEWIADGTRVDGFLAHEVSSVVPEAITGIHNEVEVWKDGEELPDGVSVGDNKLDDNGNTIPKYQGIDQSKLVPLLVKTIQELEARITELENA